MSCKINNDDSFANQLITSPRDRGWAIFSLQFVIVYVCVPVSEQISSRTDVQIWTRFRKMVVYRTGSPRSDLIEINDLVLKAKVTVM